MKNSLNFNLTGDRLRSTCANSGSARMRLRLFRGLKRRDRHSISRILKRRAPLAVGRYSFRSGNNCVGSFQRLGRVSN